MEHDMLLGTVGRRRRRRHIILLLLLLLLQLLLVFTASLLGQGRVATETK